MKKIFNLLVVTLFLGSTVYAQTGREPYLTKSLSKETVSDVFARTSGGSILVQGVNSGEARIEVYITGNNNKSISNQEIKERLQEDYEFTVEAKGGKLVATAEPKGFFKDWNNALNISFKIYVPSKISTDLNTSGGGIELNNLSGTHNFATSGGGLSLTKISGKIRGKTSGGGIMVRDSKDDITLTTSGGSIDASNCIGNVRLNTSGGRIELENLDGKIEAETSGGPIKGENIRGTLYAHTSGGSIDLQNLKCGLDASTSGGNMDVEIVEVVAEITVNNSGGNINLEIPGNKGLDLRLRGDKVNTVDLTNFSGDQEEDHITGKVNGGGTDVHASTSGRLTFRMK